MQNSSNFLVYVHCKPDGTPFYVGKGNSRTRRHLVFTRKNKWYTSTVQKYGTPEVLIIKDSLSEQEAFALEITTIKKLREQDVKLTNMTDGGEGGLVGYKHTEESKSKMSVSIKNAYKKPEYKAKLKATFKKPEVKAKLSNAIKQGRANPIVKNKATQNTKRSELLKRIPGILSLTTEQQRLEIKKSLKYSIIHGYYARLHNLPHSPCTPKYIVDAWFAENKELVVQDQLELLKWN